MNTVSRRPLVYKKEIEADDVKGVYGRMIELMHA